MPHTLLLLWAKAESEIYCCTKCSAVVANSNGQDLVNLLVVLFYQTCLGSCGSRISRLGAPTRWWGRPPTRMLFGGNMGKNERIESHWWGRCRCNSQKYTYPRNYTPGIFLCTKISQKHTGGMFSCQAIRNR